MDTATEYFLLALNHILEAGEIKQKDIAHMTGTAPQTISGIVNHRKIAGQRKQQEIAKACGYEYLDFLELGKAIQRGEAPQMNVTTGDNSHAVGHNMTVTNNASNQPLSPGVQYLLSLLSEKDKNGRMLQRFIAEMIALPETE